MTSGLSLSILLALSAQATVPGTAREDPLPPYLPLRAPALAAYCATPEGAALAERLTSFCAGYLRAVLENDPRLDNCHPLMAHVMEEIIRRQRAAPLTDNAVLARDFVVEVARDLCGRGQP
jgi:hypothetical protein